MVLTCSTTNGAMAWLYNGAETSASFVESLDPIGDSISFQESGFMFSAELISKRPPVFATTLSFSVDTALNGDSVSCRVSGQLSNYTIQVQRGEKQCTKQLVLL